MPATLSRSAFEAQVGDALDRALSQPVIITKNGKPENVVLSYEEYQRLAARDRRILQLEDWSEDDIRALEGTVMEPRHEVLNAELKP